MSTRIDIEVESRRRGLEELRPALEAALESHLHGHLLSHRWEGGELRLSGPGARGTITVEDGWICCRAKLRLPASLLRSKIEAELRGALRQVASAGEREG